jgi:peptidoglycan-associated lipoprotein
MLKQICSIFIVAMLAILMAGCRHHQPIAKTTPPAPPIQPAPAVGAATVPPAVVAPTPEPKRAELTDEELFAQKVKDIFFAYDNAEIRADEKSVLDADAHFLAAHPDWQLTIEGHCDERGSEDYNMALGQNRAKQVMDALVREGVSGSAVKLISLGKERPFCSSANNEACWSQNRRAHFVLQKKERASMN